MSAERQLEDTALQQELWNEAFTEMLVSEEDWDTKEQADFYSEVLANAVITGDMSVRDLRDMSAEMNGLAKEAAEKSQGSIENFGDADYFEALARQIGSQTTKAALKLVGSKDSRKSYSQYYMGQTPQSPMPGLGRPEPTKHLPL